MNDLKAKQTANDWGSRNHIHTLVLITVTLIAIYFCYRLTVPFFPALAWALALAVLFAPLHRWLESKVKYPNLAASLSILMVALIVVVPATFVLERMVGEAIRGAETISTMWSLGNGAAPSSLIHSLRQSASG